MPVAVAIDGPAKPFFEKGKAFYEQRRGLLDMSCKNCHEDNAGSILRANVLTQGQSNGFPTYRLKWQKVGSLHRRFRGCNKQVRATPYKNGSDEYVNLELYVAWRGVGLAVETPAVRN
jgi:sulfur-oxidizing protein SoxA